MIARLPALVAVALAVLLSACAATSGLTPEGEAAFFAAQRSAAELPACEVRCPDEGCVFSSLTCYGAAAPQIRSLQPQPHPAWGLADTTIRTLGPLGQIYLIGDAAVRLSDTVGRRVGDVARDVTVVEQPAPVVVDSPDPVIVPAPGPVIVPAPELVIIDPVIVHPVVVEP